MQCNLVSMFCRQRLADRRLTCGGRGGIRATGLRNRSTTAIVAASTVSSYLSSVSLVQPPARLQALCDAIAACGANMLNPSDRQGLHPLVVPLATVVADAENERPSPLSTLLWNSPSPSSPTSSEPVVVGLLRWPCATGGDGASAGGRVLQVVSCSRGSPTVELVARSADEFLVQLLAEEASASASVGGPGGSKGSFGGSESGFGRGGLPVASAAGPAADGLLSPSLLSAIAKSSGRGEGASAGRATGGDGGRLAALDRALVASGTLSPQLCERLLRSHLLKGDEMSALITGEWYMRRGHFPGWARPYEHVARVYSSLGREEEARDCSRVALSLPWWTLGHGFAAAAELAGLPNDGQGARDALDAAERGAGGLPPVANRSEAQIFLDRFSAVLDDGTASVGGGGGGGWEGSVDWASYAERGAAVLEEGPEELRGLASFVRGAAAA